MEPTERNLILKFLNVHYGKLEKEEHNGRYERYYKKGSRKSLILHEKKEEFIIFNTEMIVEPILNMFNTDYDETYEIIKEWICEKYDINCIKIIGGTS
jgi:hypothetical protein